MSLQRAMPAMFCFGDCGSGLENSAAADARDAEDGPAGLPYGEAAAVNVLYQGAAPGADSGSRPSRGKPVRAWLARVIDGLGIRLRTPAYARA